MKYESDFNNELSHWGAKGMHWGVRRFQNEDGTLTPAGRDRYNVGEAKDKTKKDHPNSEYGKNGIPKKAENTLEKLRDQTVKKGPKPSEVPKMAKSGPKPQAIPENAKSSNEKRGLLSNLFGPKEKTTSGLDDDSFLSSTWNPNSEGARKIMDHQAKMKAARAKANSSILGRFIQGSDSLLATLLRGSKLDPFEREMQRQGGWN